MPKRRKDKVAPLKERLNALLMLQGSVVLVWLCIIFFAGSKTNLLTLMSQSLEAEVAGASASEYLASFILAILLLILLYKKHLFGSFISILLGLLIFTGAVLFIGLEAAFFLAAGLILFERTKQTFLGNNLLILVAVLFGSIPLGLAYSTNILILALLFFSIYDVIGVLLSRFIPTIAKGAVQYHIPLLLLAPQAGIAWSEKTSLKRSAAILGSGDAFLPGIVLASITFSYSIPLGLMTLIGAVLGSLLNTVAATLIKTGIPALPLLTIGMMTAFFLFK